MSREPSTIIAGARRPKGQMTREEIVAFFDRRQNAYDNLDAAKLAADYASNCVVDSPTEGTHQGPKAVKRVFDSVFDAFLDMKTHTDQFVIDGTHVAQALTIEGTHIGDFLGLAATGKPFRFTAVFLYEFKDRQIVRERRIYDYTGMLVQIGVLKAKPI